MQQSMQQPTTPHFLRFLGTGAADWPADGCPGGRSFASMLVDDSLLIDCTPQGLRQMQAFGVNPQGITDVFITHSHDDHFSVPALLHLAELRAAAGAQNPLRVHLDRQVAAALPESNLLQVLPLAICEPVTAAGFTVLPLRSNHAGTMPGEMPLIYLFTNSEASFLYATDGAWLPLETWKALKNNHPQLDAWVVDCTIGDGHRGDSRIFEHNSLEMVRIMADTFFAEHMLNPGAAVILTHLARTLHPSPSELASRLRPPFIAACDGYVHPIGSASRLV